MQLAPSLPLFCTRRSNAAPTWLAWNEARLVGCNLCKPVWGMGEVDRVQAPGTYRATDMWRAAS